MSNDFTEPAKIAAQGNGNGRGDHLVVQFGPYTHHGIDMGDGRVIHFGRGLHDKTNARIEIVDRADFCGDRPTKVKAIPAAFDPDEIIARAELRLGQADYDLFDNNCEHFVNWCRLGVANSSQINLVDTVCRRGGATVAKLAPNLMARFAAKDAIQLIANRFTLPAALAGDAVQFSAEVIAIRKGKDQKQTRAIGQRSGALASSGIGYMLAGPAGAAVGFSSWLFGEMVGQSSNTSLQLNLNRWSGNAPRSELG